MIIDKVMGSGLENELIQFMKSHLNIQEDAAKLIIEKIKAGEYSIENPEEFKKIETEFKKFIKNKFELDIVGNSDVENQKDARNLALQTKSAIPNILSILITVGFFSVLGYMLFNDSKPNETLLIILGSLTTAWAAVVNYWFGSSSGSAYKSEVIEKMNKR